MKKIILIATIISGFTAYGQNGSWYIGGGTGFSSSSLDQGSQHSKNSSWFLSPEIGTFVTSNIQLGLGADVLGSKNTYTGGDSYTTFSYGGTVYGRYLFGDSQFKPFLGIKAGYRAGKEEIPFGAKQNIQAVHVSFNAGFAYYLTPRISVFGSVGVLGYKNTRIGDSVRNDFGVNINTMGNRFTVGMYYTFKTND